MTAQLNQTEADRREAALEAAAEAAAKHFASPEVLAKALDLIAVEDDDLLLAAQAIRAMWYATQTADSTLAIVFQAEALAALRKLTEAVFARISAYELELG